MNLSSEQIAAIALATVAATIDVAAAHPRNRRLILSTDLILLLIVIALVLIAP